jgi:type IV pilus assembly protein PilW
MSHRCHPAPRQRGFSLVELLVSVVVGLLALMFATRLFVSSEQHRESSLGGSDSMQNGMQALFSINRDVAQAGWGLNDPLIAGCDTVFSDTKGYALASAARTDGAGVTTAITPMAAVLIENNGANPDRLTLYAGTSQSGTGEVGLSTNYAGEDTIKVDRIAFGFSSGDAVLMVPESNDGVTKCALGQLTAAPTLVQPVTFNIGAGPGFRFNRAAGLGQNYTAGITRLFNLGPAESLSFHTWSVNRGFLQLRAADMGGASLTPQSVVDNIVSLKAQYGFDTSAGAAFNPESGMRITRWSSSMVDADNDTIVGGSGDYQRIAAVRLAVVARSRNPDKPDPSGVCHATPEQPIVFGTAEPAGVAAVPISVNVAVAADTVDWKCYRYRSFETVVPVRNLAWRPTSQ